MNDLDVVRWRVWYTEDRVFDGETFDDWVGLPDDGVLVLLLWFRNGTKRNAQGADSYFATPGGIYGHNLESPEDIAARYDGASVKRGKWTTDAEMARVSAEMLKAAE